jgi:excisionase family DNA binding protein
MHNDQGPPLSGFLTVTEFARLIGVSQPAVSKAIKNGRLQAYGANGERVQPGHHGRKWLRLAEAARDWDNSRVRFDDDYLVRIIGRED